MKITNLFTIIFTLCFFYSQFSFAKVDNKKKLESHKITIKEVIQTKHYTYLHAIENDNLIWLALPTMEAQTGEEYYFVGPEQMLNWKSPELNRTFDTVLFVGGLSKTPITENELNGKKHSEDNSNYKRTPKQETKLKLSIEQPEGCISLSELLKNREKYTNKSISIKGQVSKFNPAIMDKNWIHLQDGTEYNGKFDLMITSNTEVKVGDIVIFNGQISINKDLGYGYFFDVMMENAQIKK